MGFIKEFTDFAVKGNALDLAVGVIIGAAFGKVVNSIVTDIFMPPLGWAIGGVNFNAYRLDLNLSFGRWIPEELFEPRMEGLPHGSRIRKRNFDSCFLSKQSKCSVRDGRWWSREIEPVVHQRLYGVAMRALIGILQVCMT